VHGGQAEAHKVINNLGNILDQKEIETLVQAEVLGKRSLGPNFAETQLPLKPKLDFVATSHRRNAWFTAVRDTCRQFFHTFNYAAFGNEGAKVGREGVKKPRCRGGPCGRPGATTRVAPTLRRPMP